MATILPRRLIYLNISCTNWRLRSFRNHNRCVLPCIPWMQCSTFLFPSPGHLQSRSTRCRLLLYSVVRPPHMYNLHSCWNPWRKHWQYQILRRRGRSEFSLCSNHCASGARHARFHRNLMAPGPECTRRGRFQGEPSSCHVRQVFTGIQQRVTSRWPAILSVSVPRLPFVQAQVLISFLFLGLP